MAVSLGLLHERRSVHSLDPRSVESFEQRLEYVKKSLDTVKELVEKEGTLEPDTQLSVELYVDQLETYLENSKYNSHLSCVNRLEGPQTDLPLYASYLPLNNKSDFDFYLDFLSSVKNQNDEVLILLQMGINTNHVPAKCSLDGVPAQFLNHVENGGESFYKKIESSTSPYATAEVKAKAKALIETEVVPSFQKFADFLNNVYVPALPEEIASTKRHPMGAEYYQACLEFHTTTKYTCQEVHDIGLGEVARIEAEMEKIAKEEGYEKLDEYVKFLTTSPLFQPADEEALLARYRDTCGRISPALLKLFHVKTLPSTPFQIVPTPSPSNKTAPAAYYLAGGGDRPVLTRHENSTQPPGTFYANTSEIKTRYTYETDALSLHEAIPGHHTQAAVSSETEGLEDFRKYAEDRRYFEAPARFPFYTGYIEGWGLHCEGLGDELGLYKTPADRFGRLSAEMLRAVRLIVDTGMHGLGWSWQRAFDLMMEKTAMSAQDAGVETTRYCTWPGQACAYKIGEIKINSLRKSFEESTGEAGDIRDFYHIVLTSGAVPLTVLENKINELIASVKEGKKGKKGKKGLEDGGESKSNAKVKGEDDFMSSMTFAMPAWCKCCVVPGSLSGCPTNAEVK
ncbi:hypothetical protein TL16_g02881 [Triparma laevis f. inornata]|uniref:DUF885-domain-containing protein n=1 Tax=Triparma laevis f. inornata TaxID=1714386 RepID=A0A9W7A075_9STRA|nr:hypothetical protein TL16_g02881 [Triparma laevis f. inornata]